MTSNDLVLYYRISRYYGVRISGKMVMCLSIDQYHDYARRMNIQFCKMLNRTPPKPLDLAREIEKEKEK